MPCKYIITKSTTLFCMQSLELALFATSVLMTHAVEIVEVRAQIVLAAYGVRVPLPVWRPLPMLYWPCWKEETQSPLSVWPSGLSGLGVAMEDTGLLRCGDKQTSLRHAGHHLIIPPLIGHCCSSPSLGRVCRGYLHC